MAVQERVARFPEIPVRGEPWTPSAGNDSPCRASSRRRGTCSTSTGPYRDLDGVNFYEGTFGSWYSHGGSPGNECGLEECFAPGDPGCYDDLGTGELRMVLSPEMGDRYFLVSPYAGNDEGPSGLDSNGSERDPAQNTCLP